MKTTPKGTENLTDDERRVTRIDEARSIPGYPQYYITPAGWVWSCKKAKFLKHTGRKNRVTKRFGYMLQNKYGRHYYSIRDLIVGIFNTDF